MNDDSEQSRRSRAGEQASLFSLALRLCRGLARRQARRRSEMGSGRSKPKLAPLVDVLLLLMLTPRAWAISRGDFPPGFLFGVSSSAYQVEGGYLEGDKGISNWDVFSHKKGTIKDGSNGDVADDHYHRYMEDIELMHSMGVNSYRFSIAWTRILPRGRYGDLNPDGITFYNAIIDALLQKGIEPVVTIFHYDLPFELELKYGGWLSPNIQKDFGYFAELCFKMFGDRVKLWITFNEPNLLAKYSYMDGWYPPGYCFKPFGNCEFGNSTEPYVAAHHMILSHAEAVGIYRKRYQAKQGGQIGIVASSRWYEPFRNITADILAIKRALAFSAPWIMDPMILGDYPTEMRMILGTRLPEFTTEQKKKLRATKLDFIGINHYTTLYMKDCLYSPCEVDPTDGDALALGLGVRDGKPIGEPTGSSTVFIVPEGMEKVVMFYKERYNNTPIYIAENGYAQVSNSSMTTKDFTNDVGRVKYMRGHLTYLASAIRKGADVHGYFVWTLLDSFEWNLGFTQRYGLHHVDFKTLKRTPKLSARWYRMFLKGSLLQEMPENELELHHEE